MIIGLYSFDQSEWQSCKTIVSNLVEAYKLILKDQKHTFLNFSRSKSENELLQLSEEILRLNPSKIIIMDHQPHPANILSLILPRLSHKVEIILHVYGDFLLPYPGYWVSLSRYLKKFKVKFICASHKQRNFIQQFLSQKTINFVSPFPVNQSDFHFDEGDRNKVRDLFEIKQDDFCWAYIGRMSQQKNVIPLLKLFHQYKTKYKVNDKLIFVGAFDKVGVPYLGQYHNDHEFFYHFNKAYTSLPKNIRKDIQYLGFYEGKQLASIYSAADGFISLSSHNDEDYGMAVAEAMCSGLSCILSDWGGYSSFPKYACNEQRIELINFQLKKGQFFYNENQFFEKMALVKKVKNDRLSHSQVSLEKLGILPVSLRLKAILQREVPVFDGFSSQLLVLAMMWKGGDPFRATNERFNTYYKILYEPYYR